MADIVDRLIWADTNTLDIGIADLCVEARNEIELLRTALALAVGELSTQSKYRVLSPEMVMNLIMEEARRG